VNADGYTLLGLTAIVAVLVAVVAFALLRFLTAARQARRAMREGGSETALLSTALHDALARLAAQERAMSARATASEQLSTQVFDSLTAGLIVVDGDGTVRVANPAAVRMLGLPAGATERSFRDLLAGAPPLVQLVTEGLAAARPLVRRTVQVQSSSVTWHFGVTVSPFGTPGPGQGVICLFSDLTAIVELEHQLQLREALARLGELTAGIAHEFRNGLATIHGYSRLIDPDRIPAPYRPCVEGIRQETDTLGRVVTNFLNFARPEQVVFAPVDLGALARVVIADLHPELPPGASLRLEGVWGVVPGDEVMLRQLLVNLVRNAVEACETAGIIPAVLIEGRVAPDRGVATLVVADNGPGIPAGDRQRIFQPFFTTRARGSGLGLAIVQKLTLLHNGTVSAGAAEGGGGRIEMTFPIAP
jgi:signal transduction histidine kinase